MPFRLLNKRSFVTKLISVSFCIRVGQSIDRGSRGVRRLLLYWFDIRYGSRRVLGQDIRFICRNNGLDLHRSTRINRRHVHLRPRKVSRPHPSFAGTSMTDEPVVSVEKVLAGHSTNDRPHARSLLANHVAFCRPCIDQRPAGGFHHLPIVRQAGLLCLERRTGKQSALCSFHRQFPRNGSNHFRPIGDAR